MPAGDGGLEIDVGRGDDAHVDDLDRVAADRLHLAGLERAEQLHLRAGGQVSDLVEEQRAAVRGLEETGARADCARERAARVTEELALDELLRDRRAVHGDHRLAGASRAVVDRARDELLARAALAEHENRRVRGRDALDASIDVAHRRAAADHLAGGRSRARARAGAAPSARAGGGTAPR